MFAASKTNSASTGGYQISRSLRFNSADSAYLNRTPASASNQKTWTFSAWIKRAAISTTEVTVFGKADTYISINSNSLTVNFANGGANYFMQATAVLRDPSAWYHIVIVLDTTQATAANRASMYVNGVQTTAFQLSTYTNMAQNYDAAVNSAAAHAIGRYSGASPSAYFDGYMTEVNFIDGQALTPSSFGQTDAQTGVWTPKAYSGSYGTNGFYLNFSDNSNTTAATLGKDYSGNGNNWTPNNFSVTAGAGNDSLVDSPTSYGTDTGVGGTVRGNYATLNPLDNQLVLSNGNLQFNRSVASWVSSRATIGMTSGKWYWEVTATAATGTLYCMVGVSLNSCTLNDYFGVSSAGWGYSAHDGYKYNAGGLAYGSTWVVNDVIGIAFDADAGTITFYKNNVSQGTAYTGLTSGPYFPTVALNGTVTAYINFGQRPFAYTAPSGYKALCTQNLPTPAIGATSNTLASSFFAPVLYTGTGATQSVTVGFQPDFTWFKVRNQAYGHALFDSVRGAGNALQSNNTNAEAAWGSTTLTAFTSTGLTLGADTSYLVVNSSGNTFVAWNWRAGNNAGSTNTAGSITSTVSANTTSGFSVVTYTGTGTTGTIGHGLGVAPSMIIVKCRSNATTNWYTYHISIGNTGALGLNLTDATITSSSFWNNTSPTSSVFTISGASGELNGSGRTYVAYAFAEVAGFSKIGSYIGNGSADGPFIYCGFKPAFVMFKNASSTGAWGMYDRLRAVTYNPQNAVLYPNYSNAENIDPSYTYIDFVSNGIKIRSTGADFNFVNGNTYIFMAFAENPFKYSLAR